jgi:hypothetical protein
LLQNGKFNSAIKNIAAQYTIGNDLIYKYDTETQYSGNEFLYFENKDIRAANNNISRVARNLQFYIRIMRPYSSQDINGNLCKILMFQIALLKLITLGFISAFLPLF